MDKWTFLSLSFYIFFFFVLYTGKAANLDVYKLLEKFGKKYAISSNSLTWSTALNTCRSNGYTGLFRIDSTEEAEFIRQEIFSQSTKTYWISGNDKKMSNSFRWEDETPIPFTFLDWFPGHCSSVKYCDVQPNDNGDCIEYMREFYSYNKLKLANRHYWNDGNCYKSTQFICEGIAPTTSPTVETTTVPLTTESTTTEPTTTELISSKHTTSESTIPESTTSLGQTTTSMGQTTTDKEKETSLKIESSSQTLESSRFHVSTRLSTFPSTRRKQAISTSQGLLSSIITSSWKRSSTIESATEQNISMTHGILTTQAQKTENLTSIESDTKFPTTIKQTTVSNGRTFRKSSISQLYKKETMSELTSTESSRISDLTTDAKINRKNFLWKMPTEEAPKERKPWHIFTDVKSLIFGFGWPWVLLFLPCFLLATCSDIDTEIRRRLKLRRASRRLSDCYETV
ncbi:DgyrCDS9582 [Dimorphilus gyrociliatus]|uniref:DgyrCDS9582 n=1 Tax=Dimorphilus gyrociliatus TaxID=2664684 RepID=A0A7I8VXF4_9ANNE|nr:DgyrCDS9582 [Dimorphilus gyrociliatus]